MNNNSTSTTINSIIAELSKSNKTFDMYDVVDTFSKTQNVETHEAYRIVNNFAKGNK